MAAIYFASLIEVHVVTWQQLLQELRLLVHDLKSKLVECNGSYMNQSFRANVNVHDIHKQFVQAQLSKLILVMSHLQILDDWK